MLDISSFLLPIGYPRKPVCAVNSIVFEESRSLKLVSVPGRLLGHLILKVNATPHFESNDFIEKLFFKWEGPQKSAPFIILYIFEYILLSCRFVINEQPLNWYNFWKFYDWKSNIIGLFLNQTTIKIFTDNVGREFRSCVFLYFFVS